MRDDTLKRSKPILSVYKRKQNIHEADHLRDLIHANTPYTFTQTKDFSLSHLRILARPYFYPKMIHHYKTTTTTEYPFYEIEKFSKPWPRGDKIKKNSKLPDSVVDALPIKPSRQCLFRGFVNAKVGFRPQQITYLDNAFKPLMEDGIGRGYMFEAYKHTEFKIHVHGAWPTQISNMQDFADPVIDRGPDELLACIKRRCKKKAIKLPSVFEGIDEREVLTVGTNPTSHSGFATEQFLDVNHKNTDGFTKPIALHIFNRVSKEYCVDRTLWTVGARGRNQSVEEVKELRSRVVMSPESIPKIISLAVSLPWMENICDLNRQDPSNEIGVGIDFMNGNFKKFSDIYDGYLYNMEDDWKGFDTKVNESMMVVAFGMIRACYPSDEKYDKIFYYICSSFIFKNLVVPGGIVYSLHKGIPSGSPWTTAIGCLVNWIAWSVLLDGHEKENSVTCYGDDTQVGFNDSAINPKLTNEYLDHQLKFLPLVSKKRKFFSVYDTWVKDDGATLLKTWSNYGLPARRASDFYESVLYGGKATSKASKYTEFKKVQYNIWERQIRLTGAHYNSPFNLTPNEVVLKWRKIMQEIVLKKVFKEGTPLYHDELKAMGSARVRSSWFGWNRFLLPLWAGSSDNKLVLPWLEKQKYYTKLYFVYDELANKMIRINLG